MQLMEYMLLCNTDSDQRHQWQKWLLGFNIDFDGWKQIHTLAVSGERRPYYSRTMLDAGILTAYSFVNFQYDIASRI